MAGVLNQQITDRWAIYNGDSMDLMATLPDRSIHASIYSPPFAGLYVYSSSDRDVSNARNYAEFREHYGMFVREIHRLTKPGRLTAVHAAPVPSSNTGRDSYFDFPGDVIRLHEESSSAPAPARSCSPRSWESVPRSTSPCGSVATGLAAS